MENKNVDYVVSRLEVVSWIPHRQQEHAFLRGYTKLREGGGSSLIKQGTYTIPFTFNLPSSLPSSTQYPGHRGKDYNCRIQVRRVHVSV